jgi:hypothetical protein
MVPVVVRTALACSRGYAGTDPVTKRRHSWNQSLHADPAHSSRTAVNPSPGPRAPTPILVKIGGRATRGPDTSTGVPRG